MNKNFTGIVSFYRDRVVGQIADSPTKCIEDLFAMLCGSQSRKIVMKLYLLLCDKKL